MSEPSPTANANGAVTNNRILVYLRIRPPNVPEEAWLASGEYGKIMLDPHETVSAERFATLRQSMKTYEFDRVFREDIAQEEIFQSAALPTIEHAFCGFSGAVMAYGQTGTGKTHTMKGGESGPERGIVPRCAEYIFHRIAKDRSVYEDTVTASFVEIYCDRLKDLMAVDSPEVTIDPEKERVELPGITVSRLDNVAAFMEYFSRGDRQRVVRATRMNAVSSRGHAALIVNVRRTPRAVTEDARTLLGKIVLVDLAGYERFTQTGAEGVAVREAQKINASLLALGGVVNALADNAKHIPYRNAKLTRLLKDCLGGKSKTSIICTMGPVDKYREETSGTLFFGSRAMTVKVVAKQVQVACFDPVAALRLLRENMKSATIRVRNMMSWWAKGSAATYAHYVNTNGVPIDADTGEIVLPLSASEAELRGEVATPPSVHRRDVEVEAAVMAVEEGNDGISTDPASASAHFASSVGSLGDTAQRAAQEVRSAFELEKAEQMRRRQQESRRLALSQAEEVEALVQRGAADAVVKALEEEHHHIMQLQQEMCKLEEEQISNEQEREEMEAILCAALRNHSPSEPEYDRLRSLVLYLRGACESKTDVVSMLLDHYIHEEQHVKDLESQQSNVAVAMQLDMEERRSSIVSDHQAQLRTQEEIIRCLQDNLVEMQKQNEVLQKKVAHQQPQQQQRVAPYSPQPLYGGQRGPSPHHIGVGSPAPAVYAVPANRQSSSPNALPPAAFHDTPPRPGQALPANTSPERIIFRSGRSGSV